MIGYCITNKTTGFAPRSQKNKANYLHRAIFGADQAAPWQNSWIVLNRRPALLNHTGMFTIRIAAPEDIDAIAAIINAAFEIERPMRVHADRTSSKDVRELFDCGDRFFVAELEDRIVGAVLVRITDTTGYFGMLSVEPGLQGTGIGRALREQAEKFCKEHGCTEMTLTTGDFRTELLPYYERAGYKVVSIEPGPEGWDLSRKVQIVHMMKSLKAVGV